MIVIMDVLHIKHKVALMILYDSEKRFLLQCRTDDAKYLPGYWALFGGRIEEGETPEQAVRREIFEELHYMVKSPMLFIERAYVVDDVNGYMYVFIEEFHGEKRNLRLNEGKDFGWYGIEQMHGLKMLNHDRELFKLADMYIRSVEEKGVDR